MKWIHVLLNYMTTIFLHASLPLYFALQNDWLIRIIIVWHYVLNRMCVLFYFRVYVVTMVTLVVTGRSAAVDESSWRWWCSHLADFDKREEDTCWYSWSQGYSMGKLTMHWLVVHTVTMSQSINVIKCCYYIHSCCVQWVMYT